MSFLDNFNKEIKKVTKTKEIKKVTKEIKKVVDTTNDLNMAAFRENADMAIDLGNVLTGYQFKDEMDDAKKALSDAGLPTTTEAIANNYYDFLPAMREEVETKQNELKRLYQIAQEAETKRNDASSKLGEMLDSIKILAQSSLEAETLFAEAAQIPYWQEWPNLSNVPVDTLNNLKTSCAKWDAICQKILISHGVSTLGEGGVATTGIIITTIGKASTVVNASRLATVGKLAKFGKLAGKASAVLSVVTIGLDIGLSVAQLENQKETLQENIDDLNTGIAQINEDIDDMVTETSQIQSQIQELLSSVTPPVDENNWDNWVKQEQERLDAALKNLTSAQGLYERAFKLAKANQNAPYNERLEDIQCIDDSITEAQAKQIISAADGTATITPVIVDPSLLGNYENHLYDNGGKNDWHYVTISQVDDSTLKWTNRAGVSWTLTMTSEKTKLNVGEDCPYFQEGYKQATVVWKGDQVSGLLGPWNELYQK